LIVINLIVSLAAIAVLQLLGMYVFSLVTRFDDQTELKKGNVAVGIAFGGKFIATAIILGVSAYTNTSIWHMALWFAIGYVCLLVSYFIFDWVTPQIKLNDHLRDGNLAVGVLLACVYVGTAFAISSLIV
jgi:putative membrane protein